MPKEARKGQAMKSYCLVTGARSLLKGEMKTKEGDGPSGMSPVLSVSHSCAT